MLSVKKKEVSHQSVYRTYMQREKSLGGRISNTDSAHFMRFSIVSVTMIYVFNWKMHILD